MWFGQKEDGITGCFESEKAVEIVDDDQGMEYRKFKENRIIFVSIINCCSGTLLLVSFSLKLLNDVRLSYTIQYCLSLSRPRGSPLTSKIVRR